MADKITVNNTEGKEIASVDNNKINKTFDTALIGEKVEDYMVEINNNFVKLLENFAGERQPPMAATEAGTVEGQIWYDKANNRLNYKTATQWTSNANQLSGKTLDGIREYVLSGLDTTGKLSKTGGNITGDVNINGAIEVRKTVTPEKTDTSSLGGPNNRFRNIYLKEDGIVLGDASAGLVFKPHNFVYVVSDDDQDVSGFPTGAIILHQETGEAIIKKSTGTFDKNNNTFRKLADDKQNSAVIGGNYFNILGNLGLIAGGTSSTHGGHANKHIEKISIATPGSKGSFGNLTYGRSHMGPGMSSGVRAVFQGGWNGSHGNHNANMDYVTFATEGNATSFGSFGHENYGASSVSDGVRGVIGPGYNATGIGATGHHHIARYITLETPGNASQFGTIKSAYWGSAVSSGTRGVFGGYTRSGWINTLEYITIQTPSNSVEFGAINGYHAGPTSVTDMIKGVYFGGCSNHNKIYYITIATLSNGILFGNCSTVHDGAGVSNGIVGVSACYTGNSNAAEYINIQTPSNAFHFGNLDVKRNSRPSSASGN